MTQGKPMGRPPGSGRAPDWRKYLTDAEAEIVSTGDVSIAYWRSEIGRIRGVASQRMYRAGGADRKQ